MPWEPVLGELCPCGKAAGGGCRSPGNGCRGVEGLWLPSGAEIKSFGGLSWRRDPVQEWRKLVPLGKAWVSQLPWSCPARRDPGPISSGKAGEKLQWERSVCPALVSHVVRLFKFSPQLL